MYTMSDEDYTPEETCSTTPRKRPSQSRPETPHKRSKGYEFGEEDAERIEQAISNYGLNYQAIHRDIYQGRKDVTVNRLRNFINSEEMSEIKQTAKEGKCKVPINQSSFSLL